MSTKNPNKVLTPWQTYIFFVLTTLIQWLTSSSGIHIFTRDSCLLLGLKFSSGTHVFYKDSYTHIFFRDSLMIQSSIHLKKILDSQIELNLITQSSNHPFILKKFWTVRKIMIQSSIHLERILDIWIVLHLYSPVR